MAVQKQSFHNDSAALRHPLLLRHHRPLGHPQQQPRRVGRHQKQEGKEGLVFNSDQRKFLSRLM